MLFSFNIKYECGSCGNKWIGSKYAFQCPECNAKSIMKIDLQEEGILFTNEEESQPAGEE
ncbi:MAG: hypothetical protein QW519_04395 [Candidatus Thermoplasmatota archaeon]